MYMQLRMSVRRLQLIRKKSSLHWILGFFLLQVYRLVSGFKIRQKSTKSAFYVIDSNFLRDLKCVVLLPPDLSLDKSKIKLKSPPKLFVHIERKSNALVSAQKNWIILIWGIHIHSD